MDCIHWKDVRTSKKNSTEKSLRRVRCRACLGCRLTRQYGIASRLQYDIEKHGPDTCWFWTGTFTESDLPWSEESPRGHLTERQEKLYRKLWVRAGKARKSMSYIPHDDERREGYYRTIAWCEKLMREMDGHQPSAPTVSRRLMQLWKKRVRERIGYMPRVVYNGEYGSQTKRPHNHAVILGMSAQDAQATVDAWPYSKDIKEVQPILSEKIGSYVAKDVVKGSAFAQSYIASGREAPFMEYPRKPYLAAGQEEEIYQALLALQQSTRPYDFEHRLQVQHVGRTFTVRKDGKARHRIPYGRTAYTKAVARLDRDEEAKAMLADEARSIAHLTVTHADPNHPHYLETHKEHHDAAQRKAISRQSRAEQRHRSILARKGLER